MAKAPNPYLTVGKAARMCGVSNRTVINWISRGQLQANRLPSGHHRIHVDVLRAFLAARNRSRQRPLGAAAVAARERCWHRADAVVEHRCHECIVYRAHAAHCFVMRLEIDPGALRCEVPCEECSFFLSTYEGIGQELEFDRVACAVSRGGVVIGVNSAFRDLLGLGEERVVGRPWLDFVAPGDRDGLGRWAQQVGTRSGDAVSRIDTRMAQRDGGTVPVTLETTGFPRIAGSLVTRFHPR